MNGDSTDNPAARERMRRVFERVSQHCDLPALPAIAGKAMRLAREPEANAFHLTRVISMDPTLAARVLRMAGSAVYALPTPPRSLLEAVSTVAVDDLKRLLFAAATRSVYAGRDEQAEALWAHAIGTAFAADELAVRAGQPRGGLPFIAGLLHDVGRLVFHLADPAAFRTIGVPTDPREEQIFGVRHAAVSGCLVEQWGLDDEIVAAVLFHHDAVMSPLALLIQEAERLADAIGLGEPGAATDRTDLIHSDLSASLIASIARQAPLFE